MLAFVTISTRTIIGCVIMYKENIFLKIITYGPLIFIPLIVSIIIIIFIQTFNSTFQKNIDDAKKDLYNIEKQIIKDKVTGISELIIYKKSIIKEEITFRVKSRVENAYLQAQNIYNINKNTKSSSEIKKMIKDTLRPLVWNDGESFIWIVDYDGIFNLAPNYLQHLEGSSILSFQDVTGRYIIKEEIAICKKYGDGFLWDTFTKPNDPTKKQYDQVAFVKAFGHYNWYLGSAEYLDTATKKTNNQLLKIIEKIDPINTHYLFLINDKGDVYITKPKFGIEALHVSKIKKKEFTEAAYKVIDSLKDKNEASISYIFINPDTQQSEQKYSYVKRIPGTDWIIGSGFYLSYIQNKISKTKVDMYEVFHKESMYIIYIAIVLVILSLLISYYVSKKLRISFKNYEQHIYNKNIELKELNNTLEDRVDKRTAELEHIKNELEVLATTDMLTQMNNRYSIMKITSIEISRAHRYNSHLSLIMYDIDTFKKVNDTFGHDVGDLVLTSLSTLVKKNLRTGDIIGRYGGEEFLVVLPNTKLNDAKVFANRLREEVEAHLFDSVGNITISLGLVELQTNETIDELFKRVDKLLYKSKNNGRNLVSF